MALGFGVTVGSAITDEVLSPYAGNSTAFTISVRYKRNGTGGAFPRIITKGTGTETVSLFLNSSNTIIEIAVARGGFDVTTGFLNGTSSGHYITNGADTSTHHLLVSWNVSATGNAPTWALDGTTQTNNVYNAGSGALLTNAESWGLGNSALGTDYWDGTICDVAIWSVALSNFLATAKAINLGLSPLLVQPNSLVSYMPLIETGGRDYIAGATTTTGTAYQAHLKGIQWPATRQTAFSDLHYTLQPAGAPSSEALGLGGVLLLSSPAGAPSTGSRGADALVALASPAGAPSLGSRGADAALLLASPPGSPSWEAPGADAVSVQVSPAGGESGQEAGANAGVMLASPAGAWSNDDPGTPAVGLSVAAAGVDATDDGGATLAILAQPTGAPVEDGGGAAMGLTLNPAGVETEEKAGEGSAVLALSPAGAPSAEASGSPGLALLVSPQGPASGVAAGSPVAISILPPGVAATGGAVLVPRLAWDGGVAGEVPPDHERRALLIESSVSVELLDAIEVIP